MARHPDLEDICTTHGQERVLKESGEPCRELLRVPEQVPTQCAWTPTIYKQFSYQYPYLLDTFYSAFDALCTFMYLLFQVACSCSCSCTYPFVRTCPYGTVSGCCSVALGRYHVLGTYLYAVPKMLISSKRSRVFLSSLLGQLKISNFFNKRKCHKIVHLFGVLSNF